MEEQAKALLKRAISEGAEPCIMHGRVAFRPTPSPGLAFRVMNFCKDRKQEAVMLKLIRDMQPAAERGE